MAPKLNKVGGKLTTYACGEDMPGTSRSSSATGCSSSSPCSSPSCTWPRWSSPPSRPGKIVLFAVLYLAVIFLSIMALVGTTGADMLKKLTRWSRIKSPWILHLNSGACNACDIEVVAALTPRFDVERFGVLLKATPAPRRRHHRHRPGHPPAAGPDHPHLRADPRPQVRRRRRRLRHVRLRLPRRLQHHGRPRPGHPGERLRPRLPGPARRHPGRRRQAPGETLRRRRMTDTETIEKAKAAPGRQGPRAHQPRRRRVFLTVAPADLAAVGRRSCKTSSACGTSPRSAALDKGDAFEILYHFGDTPGDRSTSGPRIPKADPHLPSPSAPSSPGAVLYERELQDMFGIVVDDIPDPRRLLMPDDWPAGQVPPAEGLEVRAARRKSSPEASHEVPNPHRPPAPGPQGADQPAHDRRGRGHHRTPTSASATTTAAWRSWPRKRPGSRTST